MGEKKPIGKLSENNKCKFRQDISQGCVSQLKRKIESLH